MAALSLPSSALRRATCIALMIATGACMPRERINASCQWQDGAAVPGASRRHLEEDVRVAQDLGIRYGDSVAGRIWNDANRSARERCTSAMLDSVMHRHAVARAAIDNAIGARVAWPDVLLVFAPMVILLIGASRIVVRYVASGYDADDRVIPIVIFIAVTPIAALAAVGLAQIWSVLVEEARMRSDHISYRAAYLPLYVHRPWVLVMSGIVFAAVAAGYRRHLAAGRRRAR